MGSHRPGQLNSSASSSKLADTCGLRWGWWSKFFMGFFLANVHHLIWMILVLWYGFVLWCVEWCFEWCLLYDMDCLTDVFLMIWICFDFLRPPLHSILRVARTRSFCHAMALMLCSCSACVVHTGLPPKAAKHVGLSENSVPLNPMVNDHYPY